LDTFLYTDDFGYDWPGIAVRFFNMGEQTGLRMPFYMYISQDVKLPVYYFLCTNYTCENCTEIHNSIAEGLVIL
jgi:hypothetical protein